MTTKQIHGPAKKPSVDERTARYFQTLMTALLEEGHSLRKYHVVSNAGHATIKLKTGDLNELEKLVSSMIDISDAPKNEDSADFELDIKIKDRSCIRNADEFEKMLYLVTERMMPKIKEEIESFHGGGINFESVYTREGGRIIVLEYHVRGKVKPKAKNLPIKMIISDSEACDKDALYLRSEMVSSKRFRVFISLKGTAMDQA